MMSWVLTLSLSALAGAAALVPVLAVGSRIRAERAALVEQLCRWVGLPLLAVLTIYVASRLYTPAYLVLLAATAGVLTVAFAARRCRVGFGYQVLAALILFVFLGWAGVLVGAVAAGVLTVARAVRGRGLAHHAAAALVIVALLGSEGILASAAAGGYGSGRPVWCATIGGERAVPVLLAILQRDRGASPVAEEAARELMRVGDPRDLHVLMAALGAGDSVTVETATNRLVQLGMAAVPTLVSVLEDPSASSAATAANVLVRIGPGAVPGLVDTATSSRPEVKGPTGGPAAGYPSGPDARARAVEVLGRIGDPYAVDPLIGLLRTSSDDIELTRTVARALGSIRNHRAAPPLLALLGDRKQDPAVRETAAWALGRTGEPTGRPPARDISALMASLRDPSHAVRNGAAMGLAEMGEAAVPALIAGLVERLQQPGNDLEDGDWMAWALGLMRASAGRDVLAAADARSHYGSRGCVFCEARSRVRGP